MVTIIDGRDSTLLDSGNILFQKSCCIQFFRKQSLSFSAENVCCIMSFPPELLSVIFGYLKCCRIYLEVCCFVRRANLAPTHPAPSFRQPLPFSISLPNLESDIRYIPSYLLLGYPARYFGGNFRELQILSSRRSLLDDPATLELICLRLNHRKYTAFLSKNVAIEVLCHFTQLKSREITCLSNNWKIYHFLGLCHKWST
ncbi:hypothetical protein IW262DRAFT_1361987 [Armillaria fumosa]|nr:hypothetical protein IW262DRAFT_1361987 [Armillaria fumosa]